MEKRNTRDTMQHSKGIEDSASSVLKLLLDNQDNAKLLPDLAAKIGNLFLADACIIISARLDRTNQIDCWQSSSNLWLTESKIVDRLADLSLENNLSTKVETVLSERISERTWLGIETQARQEINGFILLLKSHPDKWTNSERELLNHISDSMAIAISQTQLQQQAKTRTKYHSLLRNLSREINHSSQPNSLFQNCLTQIGTTLELDRVAILMLKYQNPLQAKKRDRQGSIRGNVEIACQWTAVDNLEDDSTTKLFEFSRSALCQQAWQNAPQYLQFASDITFPDLPLEDLPTSFPPKNSALAIVPLMGKKTNENSPAVVWGFLVLQHYTTHYWTEEELNLLDWAGIQIGTAIVHHQTLDRVQSIVDERTAQLKWSLDVQAKLSEKMRQHIAQLQKLNQLKDDFMNSMSHELKTPLTSMKMAIMMLRQGEISPEMKEKYLNILEQEWHREYNLIKDLLALQELESGKLDYRPQEVNLASAIASLGQTFRSKWQEEKGLKLEVTLSQEDLIIDTDAESLTNILNELLLNAGKYSEVDTTVVINVWREATIKKQEIAISVTSEGTGITPEELPHIFDKFRRGQGVTDRAVPGTGLGLALVQYLVEHLNGNIEVTSEPLESTPEIFVTTFVLKLPQFQPAIS